MTHRLAVLHHSRSFFPLDLYRQLGEDIDLLWVLVEDAAVGDPVLGRLLGKLGEVVVVGGLDATAAARILAEHRPEGIVTFVDDNLELAAAIAQQLQLRYHSPEVAGRLVNKARQRAALAAAGVAGPRFWEISADADPSTRRMLAQEISYPAVLKPIAGSGSRGIRLISGPEDIQGLDADAAVLIEERLDDDPAADPRFAPYLSVESVVDDGRVGHVAITGRFALADPFRETGNFIPAVVGDEQEAELTRLTEAAIAALGIRTGVLHTEIKLTSTGPKVIEVNGRLGGRPPFVLQSVSGVNLFRVAADVALGQLSELPGMARCDGIGFWRMLQPPMDAGLVQTVRGVERVVDAEYVTDVRLSRRPGDVVDWRAGTDGRVLTVRGCVPDHAQLAAMIAFIDQTVEIEYARTEAPPAAVQTVSPD